MLEKLLGSKTRVKLLQLLLNHPDEVFYLRQLARCLGLRTNAIAQELKNLVRCGLVEAKIGVPQPEAEKQKIAKKKKHPKKPRRKKQKKIQRRKKYYQINPDFILYPELKALLLKAQLLVEQNFIKKLERTGQIFYLVLAGIFVGAKEKATDLLLVGRINRRKLSRLVKKFEKELGRALNYTVMSRSEFNYRRNITDKFLFSILEDKKVVVIDRLPE